MKHLIHLLTLCGLFMASCAVQQPQNIAVQSQTKSVDQVEESFTFEKEIVEVLKPVNTTIAAPTDLKASEQLPESVEEAVQVNSPMAELPKMPADLKKLDKKHLAKQAAQNFRNLSSEEKRTVKEQLTKFSELDPMKIQGEMAQNDEINQLLLVIIALLLPPLAVYLVYGIGTEFWISLILTLLFYLPGLIYALVKIL